MRDRVIGAAECPTLMPMAIFPAMAPVLSARDFYQGKLFLATFFALALAVTLTPILIWWAEKRMAGRPFWQVLLISAGLPMFVVTGMLLALGSVHSVRNWAAFGAPEVFPALRGLIPAALVATFVYVLIQCRSSWRRRIASAVLWFLLAATVTQCWVLAVSFSDRSSFADLWHWDMAALRWKMPLVIVLPLAGAALGLLTRMGALRRPLRFVPVVAYAAALGVFFWPVRYPTTWTRTDVGPLLGAYVDSAGDLILHARPVPQRALGTGFSAVLVRPKFQDAFRAVSTLPVQVGWMSSLALSSDLHRVDLRTTVPLPDRLLGSYLRRIIVDVTSGKVLDSSTEKLQGHPDWRSRTLGPGQSWYDIQDGPPGDNVFRGATTHGDVFLIKYDRAKDTFIRVATTRGDLFLGSHQGGDFGTAGSWDGSKVHMFYLDTHFSNKQRTAVSHVLEIVTVDLEHGQVSKIRIGAQDVDGVAGVSPNGRRFVTWGYNFRTMGHPPCYTYRLFETSGEGRVLGPSCRDQELIPVWLEEGDPLLLPTCEVAGAMAEATLHDAWRLRQLWPDGREIGGRIFIEQGQEYGPQLKTRHAAILELARDGKHARAIVAEPVSVQWLPDSIVWCEQTSNGGRVVRFYPSDDRYEVLLTIP